MLVASIPAALAVVSIAVEPPAQPARSEAPERLAVVDTAGVIAVSRNHGATWTTVTRCRGRPEPAVLSDDDADEDALDPGEGPPLSDPWSASTLPRPPAHITWFAGALYFACADGPLHRWDADQGAARDVPVDQGSPATIEEMPVMLAALGSGKRLWAADRHGRLWVRGDHRTLVRAGTAPEPVIAIAELDGDVVIAGRSAIWRHDDAWHPVVTFRAHALAAAGHRLWLAGPDGLLTLEHDRVSTLDIAPLTGIAVSGDDLWLADGQALRVRPARPAPAATATRRPAHLTSRTGSRVDPSREPPPGQSPEQPITRTAAQAMRRRARWSRWLPRVVAEVSGSYRSRLGETALAETADHGASIAAWLRLSWSLDTSGRDLPTLQRSMP